MADYEHLLISPLRYPADSMEEDPSSLDFKRKSQSESLTLAKKQKCILKGKTLFCRNQKAGDSIARLTTDHVNEHMVPLEDTIPVQVGFRRVLRQLPTHESYLPINCADGSRLYLRINEVSTDDDTNCNLELYKPGKSILPNWEKTRAEAQILVEKMFTEPDARFSNDTITTESSSNTLWADKYKPRQFLDLLSPESLNVALLHWIKLWDNCVFGFDYVSKVQQTRKKYYKQVTEEKAYEEKFRIKSFWPQNEDYDTCGRPNLKVALLCGDPGLGKTTCAHIIARHAGYVVREINASDDRSLDIFKRVLDDTTQSRTEIFKNGRPNCLIFDEIDGAPGYLVDLLTGKIKEKGKNNTVKVLKRPVICICNDLYVPALKSLRQHAFVIQFPQVSIPRLVERLIQVCQKEHLVVNEHTIQTLCLKSECDIRSCLSTLQFLKVKNCSPSDAVFGQIGINDKSKGIFVVWKNIFEQGEKFSDIRQQRYSVSKQRFNKVLSIVQRFGEYQRLFDGVLENYLHCDTKDVYFQSITNQLDWSAWFENIREFMFKTQSFDLYGYLPMYFINAHFLFARKNCSLKIHMPSKKISSENTLSSAMNLLVEMPTSVSRFLNANILVTEILPAVLNLIQPKNIRPVPIQLWSARERITLKHAADIMLSYNISYTQEKALDTGAYLMKLQPDLKAIIGFTSDPQIEDKRNTAFLELAKKYLAQEVEKERMRNGLLIPAVTQKGSDKPFDESKKKRSALNRSGRDKIHFNDEPVDFFGRPILVKKQTIDTKRRGNVRQVVFKYHSGHTNAVKRHVRMQDLM